MTTLIYRVHLIEANLSVGAPAKVRPNGIRSPDRKISHQLTNVQ